MTTEESSAVDNTPVFEPSRLIDYESAEVITTMKIPPEPVLLVSGTKAHPGIEVTLEPLVYVSRPMYRGIQVVGSPTQDDGEVHIMQPIAEVPFSVQLDLKGITGRDGIEVIGATATERIDVATGSADGQ